MITQTVRFSGCAIVMIGVCALFSTWQRSSHAQKKPRAARPGRLPREVRANLKSGLIHHFRQDLGGKTITDSRPSRMAALFVSIETAPTPFLNPGSFKLATEGYLKISLKGKFQFSLSGNGPRSLSINGNQILKLSGSSQGPGLSPPVAMHKGYNIVRIEYQSPPKKDARYRLAWQSDTFSSEPVPPTVLFYDQRDPQLLTFGQLRTGRQLFATRSCAACHRLPQRIATQLADPLSNTMAEMKFAAPNLRQAARRLEPGWIYHWLLSPRSLRNHTKMPRMFHGSDDDPKDAADLAAFVATLGDSAKKPADSNSPPEETEDLVEDGELLYENLGCISCHRLTPPSTEDDFQRTSLHFVAAKFRPAALQAFLRRPREHYRSSRMPDFQLSAQEAAALSAYLRKESKGQLEPVDRLKQADRQRGRELFEQRSCANCHSTDEQGSRTTARLASLFIKTHDGGCLSRVARKGAPNFEFTGQQKRSLVEFLKLDPRSLSRHVPIEAAGRHFNSLRCIACHDRDDAQGAWPEIVVDEGVQGLAPEIPPILTFAGEKLKPQWMEKFLAGTLGYRPRNWLHARMPSFPTRAADLARGFSAEHGISPDESPQPVFDPLLAKSGEALTMKIGGLDCRQCHGIGHLKPTTMENARGVNFDHTRHRLRYGYYRRWMRDPTRVEPQTKMPKFTADGKTTTLKSIFKGDAPRQFEALWHYLHSLR